MRNVAGAGVAVLTAVVLAACGGSSQSTGRRQLSAYLTAVNRIERQLTTPLNTVDSVDRQLPATKGRRTTQTPAAQQQALAGAHTRIAAVTDRLKALPAPAAAQHLKTLIVTLAERQADLAVQTERLIAFGPAFTASLRPLGGAVSRLERVLSVNHAYGAAAVQAVYAEKAAALRRFAGTLSSVLTSLQRLQPPSSSVPIASAERRSLTRMRGSALTLATDLSTGHSAGISAVLKQFDRAAKLPASRSAQQAERTAIRAYNRQVGQLNALVADANRERLRL